MGGLGREMSLHGGEILPGRPGAGATPAPRMGLGRRGGIQLTWAVRVAVSSRRPSGPTRTTPTHRAIVPPLRGYPTILAAARGPKSRWGRTGRAGSWGRTGPHRSWGRTAKRRRTGPHRSWGRTAKRRRTGPHRSWGRTGKRADEAVGAVEAVGKRGGRGRGSRGGRRDHRAMEKVAKVPKVGPGGRFGDRCLLCCDRRRIAPIALTWLLAVGSPRWARCGVGHRSSPSKPATPHTSTCSPHS